MKARDYTIIATTYNDAGSIRQLLERMAAQTAPPKEILIADGGSGDETVARIRDFAARGGQVPVRCLTGGRLNIAQGLNLSIRAVQTDWVGIVGTGNRYPEDFFERLIEEQAASGADCVNSLLCGQDNNSFSAQYNRAYLGGRRGIASRCALNHGALVKKEVFERAGYFYEGFVYAGEDTEFYERAARLGFTIRCAASTRVYWETPRNLRELMRQERLYMIGNMQIYSGKELIRPYRAQIAKAAVLLCTLLLALTGLLTKNWPAAALFFSLLALYWIRQFVIKRGKPVLMEWLLDYSYVFYLLRCRRYLRARYKVRRTEDVACSNT